MKAQDRLIILSGVLGIGVFLLGIFWYFQPIPTPSPSVITHLPKADDRPATTKPELNNEPQARLIFVGDIMLARSVESAMLEHGADYPFAKLEDLFTNTDAVIGNFEGTVRPEQYLEVTNQMTFDTTPDNVTALAKAGFTHLSLANNHADDYGQETTSYTRQTLTDNGLIPFGDPFQSEAYITRKTLNGMSISIIGFHAFGEDATAIVDAIKTEKAAGQFVIVFPHWGVEYATTAPNVETEAARLFVQAGADLIIGAHPHVIQNIDVIDGVPVIYSLGNFLFDQDFSPETQRGLTVHVNLTETAVELKFQPINITHRQTIPIDKETSLALCAELGVINCALTVSRQ
jgi:poly-gamma-glutamate capsule biosynthesis protein CapA/YwtB (metallophosphatase superfamily)